MMEIIIISKLENQFFLEKIYIIHFVNVEIDPKLW